MPTLDRLAASVASLVTKHETRDPFELCKALGVKIQHLKLHPDVKAYYVHSRRLSRIILSDTIGEQLQRVLVAHELGHHLEHRVLTKITTFHECDLYNSVMPMEYEANLFAAELLVSDEEVIELMNEDTSFFRVARELNIPPEILDFKFRLLMPKGYGFSPMYLTSSDFLKKPI
jgi:Zn-dependent peptidase ImmA (M78 family)